MPPFSVLVALSLAAILLLGCARTSDPVEVTSDDPMLRYTGRVSFADGVAHFDWSGVTVEAAFTGASVAVRLDDPGNTFSVHLDGETFVLHAAPGDSTYLLADSLGPGPHHLKLVRRSEADFGPTGFIRLELAAGAHLVPLPAPPQRRIAFFGDSITTGYGNLGDSPTCPFSAVTQSVEVSYAGQVAAAFNAAFEVVAYHGKGVVKNYGDPSPTSEKPLPGYYPFTLAAHEKTLHQPAASRVDAIVVNLGTNDYATQPPPPDEEFVEAYAAFLARLQADYPGVPIFVVAGPLMRPQAEANIAAAVERAGEGVHLVPLQDTLVRPDDFGCAWHPNVEGHRKIAAPLIDAMRARLDW